MKFQITYWKRLGQFVIILLSSSSIKAQTGSWTVVNAEMKLTDKWNAFTEAQLRSSDFYNNFFYYEIKGGVGFQLSKKVSVLGGLGIYQTYSPVGNFKHPKVNDEFRTWLQASLGQNIKRLKLEHRIRAEQRWTSSGFRHRFRYRLNTTLPLNNLRLVPKTVYLNSSDEVYFTTRSPHFIRNRFFIGCGYVFTESFTLQAGYVRQLDITSSDKLDKGYFQSSFLFDLDLKTKTRD